MIQILLIVVWNIFDFTGGDATGDCVWRYVLYHNRACRNDCPVADCHSWQDCSVGSDPYTLAYLDGMTGHIAAAVRSLGVVDRADCTIMTDETVIAE